MVVAHHFNDGIVIVVKHLLSSEIYLFQNNINVILGTELFYIEFVFTVYRYLFNI
ncbi:MAG: hypothetical protein PHV06_03195 [bacterium]|nr:hypothetical protein [bacterium]